MSELKMILKIYKNTPEAQSEMLTVFVKKPLSQTFGWTLNTPLHS